MKNIKVSWTDLLPLQVGTAEPTEENVGSSAQVVKSSYVCLVQGFPTGGTRTPKGYEIEHQGVRRSLGHRAAYISLTEQYISQNFFGGTKNALTWQRGTSSKKGWEPLV